MTLDASFTALAILGIYAGFAALERSPRLRFRPSRFLRPHFLTDVGWYLSAVAVAILFGPLLEGLARLVESAGIPTLARADLPLWSLVLIALVLYDFGAFACHIALHRVEWLWRVHKVHHSSPLLDWLATTRAHASEHLVRSVPNKAALFAIGLPTEAVALALAVYAGFATLGHSNLRVDLLRLEPLFITPRLHRLHHVPVTTDRNFATVFSIWDRLAGSLIVRDTDAGKRFGVPGEEDSYPQSWWRQLCEPFRGRRTSSARGLGPPAAEA